MIDWFEEFATRGYSEEESRYLEELMKEYVKHSVKGLGIYLDHKHETRNMPTHKVLEYMKHIWREENGEKTDV